MSEKTSMICFPNAKINIGLNVIEKRADGFHNIESVFYPVGLSDMLEIVESDQLSFKQTGLHIPDGGKENLCLKAYQMLANDYEVPFMKIYLHKVIPVGAGLGGGSSDAAFFIKLLNDKFQLGISCGEMHNYARKLGSDCSFFITNKPSIAEGKGDKLESILLDLKDYFLVLVYPHIHISTNEAYSEVKPKTPVSLLEKDVLKYPLDEWKNFIHNDFEDSIFRIHPEIKAIKEKLYSFGALYASMTGSGSSVYGVFNREVELKKEFANCFVWTGKFSS